MYIHKPPGPYIHTPYMHTYVDTYTHTCIRSLWGASEALCGLGRHGQWLRNVLRKPRVHGESWGMFENLWVGSKMNGRFGEGLVNVQGMFVRAHGSLGVCSIDVWLF